MTIQESDLDVPWTTDKLVQLRTSKMKPMINLSITTGIYKLPRQERVFVSFLGLEGDEHDLTFHGGIDKAIHQYSHHHYLSWRSEFPDAAEKFEVGGFGENLVCEGNMNERNVCIGDVIKIGNEVVLQVSLPRNPCFKLDHRFGIKGFASNTWKKSRTGWYYRVLKEGWIGVGDGIELLERKHPDWTIERIQEYLNRNKSDLEKLTELDKIEEFGDEAKRKIKKLINSIQESKKSKEPEIWQEFELAEKKKETERISSFVFQAVGKSKEDRKLNPGCFARLKLPNGLIRSYSIVDGTTNRFRLGIALEDPSRGGSKYLHQELHQGDKLSVGKITASVPVIDSASNHIFIVGGIGITAFFTHITIYNAINFNYQLHYAVRSEADIPFRNLLEDMGDKLTVYDKSKGERMDIENILKNRTWNSQIYICGPQKMIDEVVRASNAVGITQDEIHYEAFQIATTGDPFTAEVKKKKKTVEVKENKTLLEALREAGFEVDSSCETGNCGTCKVEVCKGRVEHRGSGLSEENKSKAMLSCISRGVGHIVIDF